MRRYLFLFVVGMLLIAPTACAKKEPAPTPIPQPLPPTPPSDNDESYVPMNYYY